MNSSQKIAKNDVNNDHSTNSDRTLRKSTSQWVAAMATNFLKFSHGTFIGFTTILVGELYKKDSEIEISLSELTWFGSYCFMLPVGSLLMGLLAQNLGSRITLLISAVMFITAWAIFYFATNSAMILSAQAISGLTAPVAIGPGATYVIEITQPHLRSALMASTNLSIISGAFLTVLYSNFLYWRTIILVNVIFPIIGFVAVYMIPESPHWLASKGRFDEAKRALSWLRGWTTPENTSCEFHSLEENYKASDKNSPSDGKNSFKNVFKPYIHRSFLVPLGTICCMFMLHACTGYAPIFVYCMIIFKIIDSPIEGHMAVSLFDGSRILGAILCILIVHYTGKRKLTFTSLVGAGLLYFIISTLLFLRTQEGYASYAYTFNWICAILLIISTFLTSAGIDKVVFMFNAELFPTKFRNIGTGIGVFMYTICSAIVCKTYLYLEAAVSLSGIYLMLGFACFVCCIVFWFILPETEGRTLQEIEDHYAMKNVPQNQSNLESRVESSSV